MYQGEWREEEQEDHWALMMGQSQIMEGQKQLLTRMEGLAGLIENQCLPKQEEQDPKFSSNLYGDQSSMEKAEDDLLDWKLHYCHGKGFYLTEEERKNRVVQLTEHWKKERLRAPSWYIVPYEKRRVLETYTNDEELLYSMENISIEERFDFAFELVWRYETAFIPYTAKLQKEVRKIWEQIKLDTADSDRKPSWIYIG